MKAFTKTVHYATKPYQTFAKITYTDDGRLSISGVEGPMRNGNARGSCGQIVINLKEYDPRGHMAVSDLTPAQGWTHDTLRRFFDIWQRWHLNDMVAGTPEQMAYLRAHPINAVYPQTHYDEACKALAAVGLNPHNGYAYGSKWLREEVPQDVIDWLRALPDTEFTRTRGDRPCKE